MAQNQNWIMMMTGTEIGTQMSTYEAIKMVFKVTK